jgi:hypothetical protein
MFISQKVDHSLNYRHFDRERVPFAGGAAQITSKEYPQVTRRIAVAGYGLFNVEEPEQRHFGRTLSDLLNRAQLEQYVINVMQPYHEWVGEGDDKRLVLKLWVVWYEQIDVSRSAAVTYARTLELPEKEISIQSPASAVDIKRVTDRDGGAAGARRGKKSGNRKRTSHIRQINSGGSGSGSSSSGP